MMTREEALKALCADGSHAAHDEKSAQPIAEAFGFTARLHEEPVNVHPKGLLIPGVKKGTKVRRLGGWELADQIASHLGVQYKGALGRGTQFWNAVEAIKAKIGMVTK